MKTCRSLLAGFALLLAASVGAAEQPAVREVPRSHWAYAAMQRVEGAGVAAGYGARAFEAQRRLSRYEFAVAVQRAAQEVARASRSEGVLRAAVLGRLGLGGFPPPEELPRLIAEFAPELELLGANAAQLTRTLQPADLAGQGPHSREYDEGVRDAEAEWKKREVTLHTSGLAVLPGLRVAPRIDPELGIPHLAAAGCVVTPEILDRIRGHNDQVYRLILRHGLPAGNKREWLPQILDPVAYWRSPGPAPLPLRFDRSRAVSPDGALRVRLKSAPPDERPELVGTRSGQPFEVYLRGLDRAHPDLQVRWGPERSDLLFVHFVETDDHPWEVHAVLDARTGRWLHLVAAPAPKGQP